MQVLEEGRGVGLRVTVPPHPRQPGLSLSGSTPSEGGHGAARLSGPWSLPQRQDLLCVRHTRHQPAALPGGTSGPCGPHTRPSLSPTAAPSPHLGARWGAGGGGGWGD